MMALQEVEAAVAQAIREAGLPATADSLDHAAFLRLLTADMAPMEESHSMTKFPSMAQQDPWAVPSFSGMLKRACSTTLRRRSSTYGAAEGPSAGGAAAEPLNVVVCGALEEEAGRALPGARARGRAASPCVPCMDPSIARAGLQPVVEEKVLGAAAVATGGNGGGGGGDGPSPMLDIGGSGDGGRGGGRREIAGDHAWEGDEDDHARRHGWDLPRMSKDHIRSLFPMSVTSTVTHLDSVVEGGAGTNVSEEGVSSRAPSRDGSGGEGRGVPQFA